MTEHRIRIIQPRLRDGDIAGNLAMTLKTIRASAGQADLLVFPETCISGFPRPDNVAQLAEPLDGPSATALREAARQAGVAVAIGLAEADQGRRFNAGLLIDADGQVLLHYRKTMLYDSDQGVFEAGERWPTCEWRGLRLGLLICFDIEFAAPARALGAQGVDLIVLMDGMMHPTATSIATPCPCVRWTTSATSPWPTAWALATATLSAEAASSPIPSARRWRASRAMPRACWTCA